MVKTKWMNTLFEHRAKYPELAIVVFAVLKGLQPIEFLHIKSTAIFFAAFFSLIIVFIFDKSVKINTILLTFLFICLVSVSLQPAAPLFHSWERLGFFAVMLGVLSPLLQNRLFSLLRPIIWKTMIWCFRIIVALSMVIYIGTWFNLELFAYWRLIGFRGVTSFGMALSPICGIVLLDIVWRSLNATAPYRRLFYIVAAVMIVPMMIHSGSRIALLGTLVGLSYMAYQYRGKIRTIVSSKKARIMTVSGIAILIAVLPFVSDTISIKMSIGQRHHSLTYSRDAKWNDRLQEFKESPFIGIGFSSQTYNNGKLDDDGLKNMGSMEPGSSWLSVLAQTGILGFILILTLNINVYKRLTKKKSTTQNPPQFNILLLSLLIYLWINGIAEGWMLYPGGYMFFPYWLISGLAYNN